MAHGQKEATRETQNTKREKKHPSQTQAQPSQTELDKQRADGEGMAPAPEQKPHAH